MKFYKAKEVRKNFMGRIKHSIVLYAGFADTITKKIAEDTVNNFTKGIENDSFGLARLKSETIKQKQRKGYPSPETPLMGKDGGDKRSYKNMMIYEKLKSGYYRIRPSAMYHHSGRVKLKTLFRVHEYGAAINTGKALIFIPARPAFAKAVERTKKQVVIALVKKAIMNIINKNRDEFPRITLE